MHYYVLTYVMNQLSQNSIAHHLDLYMHSTCLCLMIIMF